MNKKLEHTSKLEPTDFISGSTYLYCVGLEQRIQLLTNALSLASKHIDKGHKHYIDIQKLLKP